MVAVGVYGPKLRQEAGKPGLRSLGPFLALRRPAG